MAFLTALVLSKVFLDSPDRLGRVVVAPVILDGRHESSGPCWVVDLRNQSWVATLIIRLLVTDVEVWLAIVALSGQCPNTQLRRIVILFSTRLEDLELHIHVLYHLVIEARVLRESLLVGVHDVNASIT